MGIIEDLQNMRQNMKQKAIEEKRNGMKDARILVNKRTYEMLSKKEVDKRLRIIPDIAKDGECMIIQEMPGIYKTDLSAMPKIENQKEKKKVELLGRKRGSRATKKKYRRRKRKK